MARDESGQSTREVASRLAQAGVKISHATIASYERGQSAPSVETLLHLAAVYGRGIDWFLDSDPELTGIRFPKAVSRVKAVEEKQYVASAARWLSAYRRLEQRPASR